MPLPHSPGWLIDYPAASEICSTASAHQLSKVKKLCSDGKIWFCFSEKSAFLQDEVVRSYFCKGQDYCCLICDGVAGLALQFPSIVNGKKFNPTDNSQKIMGASAIFHRYGVITNKRGLFVNCSDILIGTGLHVFDPIGFLSCI